MQEAQAVAGFFHQHLGVGHVGPLARQGVELVVVGGEDAAGAEAAQLGRGGQVLGHRPGDREAVEGGGAAADLIEQHQRARRGVVKDVGGFGHLHHEGGLAGRQVVAGADTGEDAIGDAQAGGLGRDPAAHLGHQLQQTRLAQIAALAAGVGAGEDQQVGLARPQRHAVGREGLLHQQLLHHRVAAGLDLQQAGFGTLGVGDLGAAVAADGGHLGQGGQGVELGHQAGGAADGGGLLAHLHPQDAEQLVLPLGGAGPELLDLALARLEIRGDEALLVGQGLAADPVLRHGARLGPAHGEEVAEGAVILELEGADAAGAALGGLQVGQPGVLVVELVAQIVQKWIHGVVDQAALGEGEGRGVEQGVAQLGGQLGQLWPGAGQGL